MTIVLNDSYLITREFIIMNSFHNQFLSQLRTRLICPLSIFFISQAQVSLQVTKIWHNWRNKTKTKQQKCYWVLGRRKEQEETFLNIFIKNRFWNVFSVCSILSLEKIISITFNLFWQQVWVLTQYVHAFKFVRIYCCYQKSRELPILTRLYNKPHSFHELTYYQMTNVC